MSMDSRYHDSIKELIESKLPAGVDPDEAVAKQIIAEGRIKVNGNFDDELSRAREWRNFLETLKYYLEGRKGPAEAEPLKKGLFRPPRPLTPLEKAISMVEEKFEDATMDARRRETDAQIAGILTGE